MAFLYDEIEANINFGTDFRMKVSPSNAVPDFTSGYVTWQNIWPPSTVPWVYGEKAFGLFDLTLDTLPGNVPILSKTQICLVNINGVWDYYSGSIDTISQQQWGEWNLNYDDAVNNIGVDFTTLDDTLLKGGSWGNFFHNGPDYTGDGLPLVLTNRSKIDAAIKKVGVDFHYTWAEVFDPNYTSVGTNIPLNLSWFLDGNYTNFFAYRQPSTPSLASYLNGNNLFVDKNFELPFSFSQQFQPDSALQIFNAADDEWVASPVAELPALNGVVTNQSFMSGTCKFRFSGLNAYTMYKARLKVNVNAYKPTIFLPWHLSHNYIPEDTVIYSECTSAFQIVGPLWNMSERRLRGGKFYDPNNKLQPSYETNTAKVIKT